MTKKNKIIFWASTIWLALGMMSTGLVQLFKVKEEVDYILQMGYPSYFLTLLGIWKILGVIVVLIPKYSVVKEWAYAGFFFSMSGAIFSLLVLGHTFTDVVPPLLLLVLTVVSWYYNPWRVGAIFSRNGTDKKVFSTVN